MSAQRYEGPGIILLPCFLVQFLFRTFGMADTYYSWFLVTELHVWMLGVRTRLNNNILFACSVLTFLE